MKMTRPIRRPTLVQQPKNWIIGAVKVLEEYRLAIYGVDRDVVPALDMCEGVLF